MNKIIESLWGGNICISEKPDTREECKRLKDEATNREGLLLKALSEEQKSKLIEYKETLYALGGEYAEDAFIKGFKLGVNLLLEVIF